LYNYDAFYYGILGANLWVLKLKMNQCA
jgi:hypothetical protein